MTGHTRRAATNASRLAASASRLAANNAARLAKSDPDDRGTGALDENVAAIKRWEQALLRERSRAERLSDRITLFAASGPMLLAHVAWFLAWIGLNLGWFGGIEPFDPFPFPFLTMTVSLEAIFLALFVLASQNRLARQSDMRAHLNLQIDLLAEREMTAVLRLLQDLSAHLGVLTSVTREQVRDLAKKTDLDLLTSRMDALVKAESVEDTSPTPSRDNGGTTMEKKPAG
jgi:uncharacterized membrane protein